MAKSLRTLLWFDLLKAALNDPLRLERTLGGRGGGETGTVWLLLFSRKPLAAQKKAKLTLGLCKWIVTLLQGGRIKLGAQHSEMALGNGAHELH
jgi:hypothetical protein